MEKIRPVPTFSRTSSTRGMGIWPRMLRLFSFLKLTVMRMSPDFFGMITTGLAHGDVECWLMLAAKNLSKAASTFLAVGGLMR